MTSELMNKYLIYLKKTYLELIDKGFKDLEFNYDVQHFLKKLIQTSDDEEAKKIIVDYLKTSRQITNAFFNMYFLLKLNNFFPNEQWSRYLIYPNNNQDDLMTSSPQDNEEQDDKISERFNTLINKVAQNEEAALKDLKNILYPKSGNESIEGIKQNVKDH